ncbi:thiolase domain-containing protein [Thermomonospora cellulosilytica]|uniref:Acetyl-CoA acetyltransferase n=1 Tax=Thermomonospora cellulosilytica TaxID=1411118 RepID=A0A7W3N5B3_9ACTN|nr:thiolase domain-containing protein [Thermomonospora cellulosilytica]MBA9007824.1 acetyl-CoA acetyltransferase [Thermomonospora cellulosilytica]
MTREIAVVAFVQTRHKTREDGLSEVEMLAPVITEIKERTGVNRFGFTCSGSCDYLAGTPFAFVQALDAVGAWPPISESHVEMDAAWALYEAYVRLLHDDIDTALVYGFGKPSQGDFREVMTQQLDPYYLAPLGPDQVSLAALQARAHMERAGAKEDDLRAVAARSRAAGRDNPFALHLDDPVPDEDYEVAPLRPYDIAPTTDGAAAIVLAAGDKARELCERPAWITGIDHRADAHGLGARDLSRSESTRVAGERAGARGVEVAELHAQFTHEELILREALGLGDDVTVNPSGGAMTANTVMAAGLVRIGEAAARIHDGTAGKVLGHASSGPCLQQNLVCVMEGEPRG